MTPTFRVEQVGLGPTPGSPRAHASKGFSVPTSSMDITLKTPLLPRASTRRGRSLCFSGLLGSGALLVACGGSGDEDRTAEFVLSFRGQPTTEVFRIRTDAPEFVALAREQLKLPASERRLAPNGIVRRGNGGYNAPWSWNLTAPHLAAVNAEGCDGLPSQVEQDLSYWIDSVGRFCPWSAYVEAEVSVADRPESRGPYISSWRLNVLR